jgi:hypothetical protein
MPRRKPTKRTTVKTANDPAPGPRVRADASDLGLAAAAQQDFGCDLSPGRARWGLSWPLPPHRAASKAALLGKVKLPQLQAACRVFMRWPMQRCT